MPDSSSFIALPSRLAKYGAAWPARRTAAGGRGGRSLRGGRSAGIAPRQTTHTWLRIAVAWLPPTEPTVASQLAVHGHRHRNAGCGHKFHQSASAAAVIQAAGGEHARPAHGARRAPAPSRPARRALGVVHVVPVGGRVGTGMHQQALPTDAGVAGGQVRRWRRRAGRGSRWPSGHLWWLACAGGVTARSSWFPRSTTAPSAARLDGRVHHGGRFGAIAHQVAQQGVPCGTFGVGMVQAGPQRAGWRGCPTAGPASCRHHGPRS